MRKLLFAVVATMGLASGAWADPIEVSTVEELTAALAEQTAGKEIVLKQSGSPYLIPSTLTITAGITLKGETGNPADIIIDAQKKFTAVYVTSTAGGALFTGLTVKGGQSVNGGGTAANTRGGGFTLASACVVSNCIVTGCVNGSNGGGVGLWMKHKDALLTHSKVSGNGDAGAGNGSGIYLELGNIYDCLIVNNGTVGKCKGGGIYIGRSDTTRKIVNCTIAGNRALDGGGFWYDWKGCEIHNTLVYDNSANTNPNYYLQWYSGSTSYNNATSPSFGMNPVVLTASPLTATYELDPATGASCIDAGDNSKVVSSKDFFGNDRIFNDGTVDIGAHEYSKIDVVLGIATPDGTTGTGPTALSLQATVQGAALSDCTFAWYLDGSSEVFSTDAVTTNVFAVGKHAVKLVVTYDDTDYPVEKPNGFITIYPKDAYVDLNGTDPVWPYDTPAHAATNIAVAVSEVLKSGVTLHLPAGNYALTNTVSIGAGARLVGAGRDKTILYNPSPSTRKFRNMYLNGAGAYVSGVCVSNAWSGTVEDGAGVCIDTAGGTFEDGSVVCCTAGQNGSGGGVCLIGSSAVMRRTIIANNATQTVTGEPKEMFCAGGVEMGDGTLLEDCIVVSNRALFAAGVRTSGGKVRNCTIVGNTAGANAHKGLCAGGGGLGAGVTAYKDWSIDNCIIWGNRDMAVAADEANMTHDVIGETYKLNTCCVPVAPTASCITNDPCFKNAAAGDYRIGAFSPCAYSGLYQAWMATAIDFFGNPRATPGKKVSIGFCQAPNKGLMILVR